MRNMKDSGIEWVGDIPSNKNIIRNKYAIQYIKGKNPSELNTTKEGLPYVGASDLSKEMTFDEYENYTSENLPTCDYNDILILWDGARAGLIGRHHKGVISSTIVKLETNENIILKRFYYWYIRGLEKYINNMVNGTTIPHMNRKFIENIAMIDFTLEEQELIADYLDNKVKEIDNIISKTQETIEEYKKYKQLVITEAVTKGLNPNVEMKYSGIKWIGDIPKYWSIVKLKNIIKSPLQYGANCSGIEYDNKLPRYIRITDIDNNNELKNTGKLSLLYKDAEPYILNNEDILFARSGATVGKTFIYKEQYGLSAFAGYLIRASVRKEISSKFVYYYTLSSSYNEWKNYIFIQATIQNIGADKYSNMEIAIPNNINEQNKIVNFLDTKCTKIDNLITKKQELITQLELYKKSLIYEYVTGKKEVAVAYGY